MVAPQVSRLTWLLIALACALDSRTGGTLVINTRREHDGMLHGSSG